MKKIWCVLMGGRLPACGKQQSHVELFCNLLYMLRQLSQAGSLPPVS